jgi:hypothetical protein
MLLERPCCCVGRPEDAVLTVLCLSTMCPATWPLVTGGVFVALGLENVESRYLAWLVLYLGL